MIVVSDAMKPTEKQKQKQNKNKTKDEQKEGNRKQTDKSRGRK